MGRVKTIICLVEQIPAVLPNLLKRYDSALYRVVIVDSIDRYSNLVHLRVMKRGTFDAGQNTVKSTLRYKSKAQDSKFSAVTAERQG
jgi:hypothetical protein